MRDFGRDTDRGRGLLSRLRKLPGGRRTQQYNLRSHRQPLRRWGHAGAEQSSAGIASAISTMVSKGYKTVLGFNEPYNTTQSNISMAAAMSLCIGWQIGCYGYSPSTIPLMYFSMFVYPVLSKSPVASEGSFGFRPYLVSQASGMPSLSVSTGAVPPASVP